MTGRDPRALGRRLPRPGLPELRTTLLGSVMGVGLCLAGLTVQAAEINADWQSQYGDEVAYDVAAQLRRAVNLRHGGARAALYGKPVLETGLDLLAGMTLADNLDIRIADTDVQRQREATQVNNAIFDPFTSVNWSYTRSKSYRRGDNFGRVRDQGTIDLGDDDEFTNCTTIILDGEDLSNCVFNDPSFTFDYEEASSEDERAPYSWTASLGGGKLFSWGGPVNASLASTFEHKNSYAVNALRLPAGPVDDPFFFGGRSPWTTDASLSFATPLPFTRNFGRSGSQAYTNLKVAESGIIQNQHRLDLTRNSALFSTVSAYWNLVESLDRLEILGRHAATLSQRFDHAQEMYDKQLITQYDYDQTRARLLDVRDQQEIAWGLYLSRSAALRNLLALEEDAIMLPGNIDEYIKTPLVADVEDAHNTALTNNPAIKQAREALTAQQFVTRFNRNQNRVEINLNASANIGENGDTFGYENWTQSISHLTDPDSFDLFVGVQLRWPFGYRAEKAGLEQAMAAERQAGYGLAATSNAVINEVNAALREIETAKAVISRSEEDISLAAMAYETALLLDERGLITKFELLERYDDLLDSRLGNLSSVISLRIAEARLLNAEGKLDSAFRPVGAPDVVAETNKEDRS